jgi:hypothetical protein
VTLTYRRSVETQKETLRKSQKAQNILELAVSYQ